ncbi:MAG: trypsin-like peptidase domain-containing protein [Deltaproteobacteria bacterium]|nr:trypsin-like peptidase domain-containing protein [Deltaproteobacteria bacterium]
MAVWHVNTEGLGDIYTVLQEIANSNREDVLFFDQGIPNIGAEGVDRVLSEADYRAWLKKNSAEAVNSIHGNFKGDRARVHSSQNEGIQPRQSQVGNLFSFWVETDLGDRFKRNGLRDFQALYEQLLELDKQDGLDGAINEIPDTVNISVPVSALVSGVLAVGVVDRLGSGQGSAWVVDRSYLGEGKWMYWLMSNAHVIDSIESEEIFRHVVLKKDNNQEVALPVYKIYGVDYSRDVAAFAVISEEEMAVLPTGHSDDIQTGDEVPVAIVGNQLGQGVVFLPGTINDPRDYFGGVAHPLIHTDCPGTKGVSGSVLLDLTTNTVIGMNTYEERQTQSKASIQYATPIDLAVESFDALFANGKFVHSSDFNEVYYEVLNPHTLSQLGLPETTAYYVISIPPGSVAERAGFKAGDVILSYNGNPLPVSSEWERLHADIAQMAVGSIVKFEVVRMTDLNNRRVIEYVTEPVSLSATKTWQTAEGYAVSDLGDRAKSTIAAHLNIDIESVGGVQVVKTEGEDNENNAQATVRGVHAGEIIIAVNGESTPNVEVYRQIYEGRNHWLPVAVTKLVQGESAGHPLRVATELMEDFSERGKVLPVLNIKAAVLTPDELHALGFSAGQQALYVTEQFDAIGAHPEDDPLYPGDVIVGYNGKKLFQSGIPSIPLIAPLFNFFAEESIDDFLGRSSTGTEFTLNVIRAGELIEVGRKKDGAMGMDLDDVGAGTPYEFLAGDLSQQAKKTLGLSPDVSGVYVIVPSTTREHPYGLLSGTVVTSVNGQPVSTVAELQLTLQEVIANKELLLIETVGNVHQQNVGSRGLLESRAHL